MSTGANSGGPVVSTSTSILWLWYLYRNKREV
jgi:hypothetical protein